MKKIVVVLCILSTHLKAEAQTDTIQLLGKCKSYRSTGNIIATTVFRFKVLKVLKGTYEKGCIEFEASSNSKVSSLFAQIKKEKQQSSFKPTDCKCSGKAIRITLIRHPDESLSSHNYEYVPE